MKLRVLSNAQPTDRSAVLKEATAYLYERITVEQNNVPLAALSIYDNPHIGFQGAATMLFGDLELPAGNADACLLLFRGAEEIAQKAGRHFLLGPMNGSTWRDYRLPLDGGNAPLFSGDLTAPASWVDIMLKAGYRQADTFHSSVADIKASRALHIREDMIIRLITPDSLTKDLQALYPLCMLAFAKAPYFSPVSEAVFAAQYDAARPLLQSGLSNIALQEGKPVAFALAYPDMLHPERKAIVIKTIARHPEATISGLIKSVGDMVYHTAWRKGYTQAIHAFMHDANRSAQRSEEFGGKLLRSYALFAKSLTPDG